MSTIDKIATERFLSDIAKEIEHTLQGMFDTFIGRAITAELIQEMDQTFTTQLEARYGHLYNQQQYTFRVNVTPSDISPNNLTLSWGLCERYPIEEESEGF